MVRQVQFRKPEGQCPDGYDFNDSTKRCYPNEYQRRVTAARAGSTRDNDQL
jgi:hypothetical protein